MHAVAANDDGTDAGGVGDADGLGDNDEVFAVDDDDYYYSVALASPAVVVALRMQTGDAYVVDNDTAEDNTADISGTRNWLYILDDTHHGPGFGGGNRADGADPMSFPVAKLDWSPVRRL